LDEGVTNMKYSYQILSRVAIALYLLDGGLVIGNPPRSPHLQTLPSSILAQFP